MHISQLKESRFLKKEDCGQGIILTICGETVENVAPDDQPPEEKCVIWFEEVEKPMVLNTTNAQLIAASTGLEDTTDWVAHRVKVEIFNDPTIMYRGKSCGGIRVRAAEISSQTRQPPGPHGFAPRQQQRPMQQQRPQRQPMNPPFRPTPKPPIPQPKATNIQPGDKNPFDE